MTTLHTTKKGPKNAEKTQTTKATQTKPLVPVPTSQPNEGEGNRTAARHYDDAVEAYVESGRSDAAAQAAKTALEGPEAEELREAEAFGKAGHPKGKSSS